MLLKVEDREFLSDDVGNLRDFSKDLDRLDRVYEYVFLNIEEGIKLDEAAQLLHMAPSSFCRYFKKKTNNMMLIKTGII
jgi:AraC-like DNA-binding protein